MRRSKILPCAIRVGFVLASVSFAGCSAMVARFGGGMSEELARNGVPARATIQEIWDTGWTINDNPVIGMKVVVLPADGPPFEATIEKTTVSRIGTWQFQPGNSVPVRFDPANRAVVAVDDSPPEAAPAVSPDPDRPAILGIVARSLSASEQVELRRTEGIVVERVLRATSAAAGGIAVGDVLVAIDGQPFGEVAAMPALIASFAGRRVAIDLLRNGFSFSVEVQLDPAAP